MRATCPPRHKQFLFLQSGGKEEEEEEEEEARCEAFLLLLLVACRVFDFFLIQRYAWFDN